MSERTIIIGGGFAGLAAAVRLSRGGKQVLLLERRKHLGGRAYSFLDSVTGDVVDNGQHLFMACYNETIQFLDSIGCLHKLKFQSSPRVEFLDRENGFTAFDCPALPAPLHALAGIFRMKGLTVWDKISALRIGAASKAGKNGAPQPTVSKWLDGLGQSPRIKERFWYPMTIATLNEDPEVASAEMMKVVLRQAFDGGRKNARIGIATVGLSDLYTMAARNAIETSGGEVRMGAAVRRLILNGDRVTGCELKDGEIIDGDSIISAVPQSAFIKILPLELMDEFANVRSLAGSPIVSINLWFDRRLFRHEFAGLLGTNIQWLFNKDIVFSVDRETTHLAIVISAAHKYVDWTKDDLVNMAVAELNQLLPESRGARILHCRIIKEREATLSHTVASDHLRPRPKTSISNLVLAGDWINTGLPATIESAVVSGHAAAEIITQATVNVAGKQQKIVV